MAFHPAANCAEVTIHYVKAGQEVINTFYGKSATEPTEEDCAALADAVDAWVNTTWKPILAQDILYAFTRVRGLSHSVDVQAENADHAGAGTNDGLVSAPNNVTLAVKRSSGLTGRAARGRIYIPGLPLETIVEATNTVSGAYVTAAVVALNLMRTAMGVAAFTEVILHRYSAGSPLGTAVIYTVIDYAVTDSVIDSMRRRLPGRGS